MITEDIVTSEEKKTRAMTGEEISDRVTAIRIMRMLILMRRNNRVKREQAYYEQLMEFCSTKGYDFNSVFFGAAAYICDPKRNKKYVADAFNGIVTEAQYIKLFKCVPSFSEV